MKKSAQQQKDQLQLDIAAQVERNTRTKRTGGKFVSKLRRWQTRKLGSRSLRVALLRENPCIVVNGVVVK